MRQHLRVDADALVLDAHREPSTLDRTVDNDRSAVSCVLKGVTHEVLEDLADPDDVDLDRRQVVRGHDDEAIGLTRDLEVAAKPRDQR